jgi:hypothetical protein
MRSSRGKTGFPSQTVPLNAKQNSGSASAPPLIFIGA